MATHLEYKIALQVFQSKRLQRDLADLAAERQYQAIGKFFFDEMYGPHDYTARDLQAHRIHLFIHRVPGISFQDVEPVLTLLELTNELDDQMTNHLIHMHAPLDFDEALYDKAYRELDNYAVRATQIDLVLLALGNVYRLGQRKLLGVALMSTQAVAHTLGMGELHRFLRLGYQAIQPVRDIQRFLNTIGERERARLDQIYADEHATAPGR